MQPKTEQDRARWAWKCVEEITRQDKKIKERYGTLARKLPSLLQVSGMGQTLAFIYAQARGEGAKGLTHTTRDPKGDSFLLHHLRGYLLDVLPPAGPTSPGGSAGQGVNKGPATLDGPDIMAVLTSLSPQEYQQLSWELMAGAGWLKRMAQGALGEEKS